MRALVIYVSLHHGNTKKVAEVIAAELHCHALTPEQVVVDALAEYDLLGFGSGLYFGPHHQTMLTFARALPRLNTRAFVFSTRGRWHVGRAHEPLKQILRSKGLDIIGGVFLSWIRHRWAAEVHRGHRAGKTERT